MVSNLLIAAGALAVCGSALAQSNQTNQAAAPLKYQSAIADYQPYQDEKRADWRAVNDSVGVPGGHGAQVREPQKSADPHAGHNMAAPKPASGPAPQAAKPVAPKAPHDMKNMGGMK